LRSSSFAGAVGSYGTMLANGVRSEDEMAALAWQPRLGAIQSIIELDPAR